MTAFRRRILALALLLVPLVATGCFEVGEVAVENRTNADIFVWNTQVQCDFDGTSSRNESRLRTLVLRGQSETVAIFETDLFDVDHCIAIGGPNTSLPGRASEVRWVTYEVERGTLYAITGTWPSVQVSAVGAYDEETFDFHVSTTMALILGVPFALGALAALWITVKFFLDFGKRPYTGVS